MPVPDHDMIVRLRKEILALEGFKAKADRGSIQDPGLQDLLQHLPNHQFPTGAIHEFMGASSEHATAASGFIVSLISHHIACKGVVIWISAARTLFPVALAQFGLSPEQLVFVDVAREKDVLWVMEEALKCEAVGAVIAEAGELSFTASRRLQLVVEHSGVTGFVLRGRKVQKMNTTACVTRWSITSTHSLDLEGLPGIGYPSWKVELLRVRNGKPGSWTITCRAGKLSIVEQPARTEKVPIRKVG
ncbi:MAG: ImuA family protein [Pseudobacter sp.]|uniref:ImuA family protein n=1 Tax=Pseudobacter sp. TaxID=2045420 RepID=UPI003F7D1C5A